MFKELDCNSMTSCEELWSRQTSVLISVLTHLFICAVINGHLAQNSGTQKKGQETILETSFSSCVV